MRPLPTSLVLVGLLAGSMVWSGVGAVAASSDHLTAAPRTFAQLAGVDVISSADIWAVGVVSSVHGESVRPLIEHGDGTTWHRVISHLPAGSTDASLAAVSAVAPNDVWAVGSATLESGSVVPIADHWDGAAWRVAKMPTPPGGFAQLEGVTAISSSDAWAVGRGDDGAVSYHWDGKAWMEIEAPSPGRKFNELSAVSGTAPDDVWATGTFVSRRWHILLNHWDGTRWSRVAPPVPPKTSGTDSLGVATFGEGSAWIGGFSERPRHGAAWAARTKRAGPDDVTIGIDKTMAEQWDGSRWRSVAPIDPLPSGNLLAGVAGTAADDVWAVGEFGRVKLHSLSEHWDGRSWSVVTVPNVPSTGGSDLRAVSAFSTSNVWAVGDVYDGGDVDGLIEHWDGHRWRVSTVISGS